MNNKYLLSDLVYRLQKKGYDAKQADLVVRSFFAAIENGLEQDELVKVNGFGQFKLQRVEARQSVDVNTGERVEIKAHSKISFLPDATLKELVNEPLSHLQPVVIDAPNEDVADTQTQMQAQVQTQMQAQEQTQTQTLSVDNVKPENTEAMKKEQAPKKAPKKATTKDQKPVFEVEETKDVKKNNQKKSNGWWLILLSLIVIALVIYAMTSMGNKKVNKKEPIKTETSAPVQQTVVSEPVEQTPPAIDPSAWPTLKTVTLEKGQRLTLLALENYGDKVFWVYIYEANKDVMPNPNQLKAGTKIRIPQLPVGLINAKDASCMARAKALEDKYRAQFAK